MTLLVIGHANGHNEQSVIKFAADTTWDSFGFAEVERLIGALSRLGQVVVHPRGFDRSQDAPVLVARRHHLIHWSTRRVTRALGKPGDSLRRVAPARTLTVAFYEHALAHQLGCKGIAHINHHPDAGPKQLNGRNPMAPITRQYRRGWRAVRRAWRRAERDGYLVVLTSDAQMDERSSRPWAPKRQAKRLGAKSWNTDIDWVLYDARLTLVAAPLTRKLFDHIGFIATFKEAR